MMRRVLLGVLAATTIWATSSTVVSAQESSNAAAVTGAGSTFAYPLVTRWAKGYQRWSSGGGDYAATGGGLDDSPTMALLDYEPSGSMAGIMRAKGGGVDFGATEMPLPSDELRKLQLVQFPIVIGGIVAAINIDGIGPGDLRLSGELLADIFLGKVTTWSAAPIQELNPNLKLPDAPINVVHRSDGSGTTYNFTNYLAKMSPQWRDKVGSDLIVQWPKGAGAKGAGGMSQVVKQTKNSIGYVDYANALQNKLAYALIRNQTGAFVSPHPGSFQSAAANADWAKADDFNLLLTDAPGASAYPIVATVFALMYTNNTPNRTRATLNFLDWSLGKGAQDAGSLGYVPLPAELVTLVKAYWSRTLPGGS